MLKTNKYFIIVCVFIFMSSHVNAMVFDNRYLPLIQPPRLAIDGSQSEFAANIFFTTAKESYGVNQTIIPLGQLYGPFNQVALARGIAAFGFPNPLPSEFQKQLKKIPWIISGKRQGQGIAFTWDQHIVSWLSTGFSWLFMRVDSRYNFFLDNQNIENNKELSMGDLQLLDDNRRELFRMVGIQEGNTVQLGFGDIDWYLRAGVTKEYQYRFRRLDVGARLGVLFPTGVTRDEAEPASIPFGGNGHWGMYGAIDGMFEVREDWKCGFFFRVSKRFPNTKCRRMPVEKDEPATFASAVGDARVDPGYTAIIAPYFLLENLRDGLALGGTMTLTWHTKDSWCDVRKNQTVKTNLTAVEHQSEWASEYFTFNALYDFGKVKSVREFNPILTFRWDIPSTLFIAHNVNKTYRVSLGLDFVY